MSSKNFPIKVLTIGDLLQAGRFVIPDSQREYSWSEKEVTELCEDLFEHMNAPSKRDVFYRFNMATWYRNGDEISIFDGQQRITTLLLLHAAVLHVVNTAITDQSFSTLTDAEQDRLKQVAAMLHNVVRVPSYTGTPTARITDQFPSSNAELAAISSFVFSNTGSLIDGAYSQAFNVILGWLELHFSGSVSMRAFAAIDYIAFVSEWGLITVDEVESLQAGWAAFARANNRGKGLNEQDRLKHLLCGNTAEAQRKEMTKKWNDTVLHAREKKVRLDEAIAAAFTARFGMSTKNRMNFSEKDIYSAVLPHGAAYSEAADGISITNFIAESTRNFTTLQRLHGPHGSVPALEVLAYVYGSVPSQLVPLLLAAWHMDKNSYERFAEEMLFCSVLHTEAIGKPQEFTSSRSRLLPIVRAWDAAKPETTKVLAEELIRFKDARGEAWGELFSKFSLVTLSSDEDGETKLHNSAKRERVARVLLGLAQDALAAEATGSTASLVGFRQRYLSTSANKAPASLEHILPRNVDAVTAEQHFNGQDAAARLAHMFGNLTWLTLAENTKASNKPYLNKIQHYSHFELARYVHAEPATHDSTSFAAMLRQHCKWNTKAIYERQEDLYRLVSRVMDIPAGAISVLIPEARENELGYNLVQASSPEKLIALGREIAAGTSKAKLTSVAATMDLSDRQVSYYRAALVELGVLHLESPRKFVLAPQFNGVFPEPDAFAQNLLKHPASLAISEVGEDLFVSRAVTDSGYDESTARRRAKGHVTLYRWAVEMARANDLAMAH